MNLTDFHFLRPEWLFAILPGVALAAFAWRRIGSGPSNWRAVVDQHLLKHLVLADHSKARKWPVAALAAGWIVAAIAMAGPTWERLPTPALDRLDPTVIVMSLAQSMNATDQSPSRLARARHKAEDILSRMRGGQVGLVVYADAPFVAAPLTEDGKVITQMMPELSTNLMPVFNDRPDLAITRAIELLKNAEAPSGRIVLLTDGTGEKPDLTLDAAKAAAKAGYSVNVIGVGTDAGSTYLAFDGTPVQGADGKRLTTRLNEAGLKSLAAAGDGRFSVLTPGDGDLDTVLAASANPVSGGPLKDSGLKADDWRDMGPWLVLVLVVLAPIAFRRGWIAVALIAVPLSSGLIAPAARAQDAQEGAPRASQTAPASTPSAEPVAASGSAASAWRNLWQTPDQQAADAFTKGQYGVASQQFQDPAWQASALYKKGDYAKAASAFKAGPDPDYNRGNALAKAGELEDAVKAYDAALKADPANADAKFNRDLVQKLIDQKKQEEQQKQQQDDQKQQSKSDDQKKNDQKNQQGGGQGQQQSGKGGGQKDKPSDQNDASGQGKDKSQSGQGGQSGQDQASQNPQGQDPQSKGQDQKDGSQKPGQQDQTQADQQAGSGQDKSQNQAGASQKPDQGQQGKDQQGQQAQAGQDQAGQDQAGQDQQGQQPPPAKPDQGQASGGGQSGQNEPGQQNAAGGGADTPTQPQPPDPATAAAQAARQQGDQAALKQALDQAIANRAKQGQPAQNGEPAKAAVAAQQPMTEQDQNREQMLRMVPDDPTGLLRARIMSHYARMGFSG